MAALSYRKPASTRAFHDDCLPQGHMKETFCIFPVMG